MTAAEIVADAAARVKAADDDAADAQAAFAAGRFAEWWANRAQQVQKGIEAGAEDALTRANDSGSGS